MLVLAAGCPSAPPRRTIVRAGRMVDGTGAPAREKVRIEIQDGTIVAIQPDAGRLAAGPDEAVIDARGLTVLPGLINGHAHLLTSGACTAGKGAGSTQAVRNLRALLAAGVTTVADLSSPAWLATALRRYVGTGRGRGPRLLVAGPMLTAPGGAGAGDMAERGSVREIDSPETARRAVRELADQGVDFIEVGLQERGFVNKPLPVLQGETLCAVVDEAHEQELRALARATTAASYEAALDCGVDAIIRAPVEPLDTALLARVRRAGIPITPTLFAIAARVPSSARVAQLDSPELRELLPGEVLDDLHAYAAEVARGGETLPPTVMPGISRRVTEQEAAAALENTRRMAAAGVPLGLGTGAASCFVWHGSPIADLELLEQAGLTPLEVLSVATSGAARVLNLQDALGRLAVGYRADLIAVEGAPDVRLRDITRVRHVLVDGIEQELGAPGWLEQASMLARVAWAWVRG